MLAITNLYLLDSGMIVMYRSLSIIKVCVGHTEKTKSQRKSTFLVNEEIKILNINY
jgi:hypothetical protein